MELIAVLIMIAAGGVTAAIIMFAVTVAGRERERSEAEIRRDDREHVAASLLYHIAREGGAPPEDALRDVRHVSRLAAPVAREVDVSSWGAHYARVASRAECERLLEEAVQIVAGVSQKVPLRQYNALLDLSFALGFQTDMLAKLRGEHPFEYVDYAKNARPRHADRSGGAAPLYVRTADDERALLERLGVEGEPSRQAIISAYRRQAARHHPDRFHGATEEARSEAAARFIEISRAYEALMAIYRH